MKKNRNISLYLSIAATVLLLAAMVFGVGRPTEALQTRPAAENFGERFHMFLTNTLSDALEGVLSMEKI